MNTSSPVPQLRRRPKFLSVIPAAASFLMLISATLTAQVNVLTYHNDNNRTGQNLNEVILTPANVNTLTFGKLFSYNVDGYIFAQPLYLSVLEIPGQGIHRVVFVATEHNTVYAFDAGSNTGANGGLLWEVNLGPSAAIPNSDFGNRYGPFNLTGTEVGITGTPVIDPTSGTIYVDAFTHEGTNYFHRIHALNITNGTEQAHSPMLVAASITGTGVGGGGNGFVTFVAKQQIQRAALTLAGRILYVAYAAYSDTNPYHGWILGYDTATLTQLTNYTFNTTPNSTTAAYGANAGEGGIWMGNGGLAVDNTTNLYFEVGNGIFNAFNNSAGTEYGDTFLRLSTSNNLSVADYFTPYNQASLADGDLDLGSGGLLLLPDQPGNFPHLLVGAGKEGKIYLINRDKMTTGNNHYDPTNNLDHVVQTIAGQINAAFDTPAYLNGTIYFAGSGDNLKAFSLTNGLLSPTPVSIGPRTFGFPGATASISANGANDGIVWALQNGNPAVLAAYNATNLTNEIYNSDQAGIIDQLTNGTRFSLPTIADGNVFIGGQNAVSVFGLLPSGPPTITTQPTGGNIVEGDSFSFNVGARGAPLPQWCRNAVPIPGATNAVYNLLNVVPNDAANYTVVLSNSFGSITSSPALLTVTSIPTYPSYQTAILADNPIHYYPLNETGGTVAVDFGSSNFGGGHYAGGYTLGQPSATSAMGTSVHFDGNPGTFVDCGLIYPGTAATVEAWVNLDADARASWNSFLCRWDGCFELDFDGANNLGIVVRNDANAFASAYMPTATACGTWHHVVGVFTTNGIVTVYVDGVQGASATLGGTLQNAGPVPDRVLIGATRDGSASSFNFLGYISQVAIYNHALSPVNIRAHFRASMPERPLLNIQQVDSTNLTLSWPTNSDLIYNLQASTNGLDGNWFNVSNSTVLSNGVIESVVPLGNTPTFYRLMR
jgi:hypothetical protein